MKCARSYQQQVLWQPFSLTCWELEASGCSLGVGLVSSWQEAHQELVLERQQELDPVPWFLVPPLPVVMQLPPHPQLHLHRPVPADPPLNDISQRRRTLNEATTRTTCKRHQNVPLSSSSLLLLIFLFLPRLPFFGLTPPFSASSTSPLQFSEWRTMVF